MAILDENSLSATLDALNERRFFGKPIPKSEAKRIAKWIAGLQGLPGSYADMFAPTKVDVAKGLKLFTGEDVRSNASTRHILGEEACRALILLERDSGESLPALARATEGMATCLANFRKKGKPAGFFCCGTCTAALWRHLAVGGLNDSERLLPQGIRILKKHRTRDGKWRRFPYFYTLLALLESDVPEAVSEMKYAASGCERLLTQKEKDGIFSRRKRALAERVLEKI